MKLDRADSSVGGWVGLSWPAKLVYIKDGLPLRYWASKLIKGPGLFGETFN